MNRSAHTVLAVMAAAITISTVAAAPPTPADWSIHLEVSAFILPETAALPFLDDFNDETKSVAAAEKLQAAARLGTAELAGRVSAVTRSAGAPTGNEGTAIRYPILFDNLKSPNVESKAEVRQVSPQTRELPLPPSDFESRDSGLFFESKCSVSADGQQIALDLNASHVRLLGWDSHDAGLLPQGTRITFQLPKFSQLRDQGSFAVLSSNTILIGTHLLAGEPHRMEFLVLRAWTTPMPSPEKK